MNIHTEEGNGNEHTGRGRMVGKCNVLWTDIRGCCMKIDEGVLEEKNGLMTLSWSTVYRN